MQPSSGSAPNARTQRMFPVLSNHLHPHTHPNRQASPFTIPMTQSIDIVGGSLADKLEYDYNVQGIHSHGASMDIETYGRSNKVHPIRDRDIIYGSYGHAYEGGTFPRKKENQRFRIPSNPSVTSKGSDVKNSTGSIEHHGSEHGSSMTPAYKVEVMGHDANKRNSMPDFNPSSGDLRQVVLDKSAAPLGITIHPSKKGGIFIASVKPNSLASQVCISSLNGIYYRSDANNPFFLSLQVGLQSGDQLLEVCGINMRDATCDLASKVFRQCGNVMTMLVQYSPESM